MELNCVVCFAFQDVFRLEEHAESFENGYGPAAVVVGARSGQDRGKEEVDAILVRTNDDSLVALAGNGGDDGRLTPRMRECLDGCFDSAGISKSLVDLAEEPCRALDSVVLLVVARMEGGEGLKMGAHVILLQLLEQRDDALIVDRFLGELDALRRDSLQRAELLIVRDVEEVDVLLPIVSRDFCLSYHRRQHTLRSSHFSSSVTHLVSPGESSIRYSSGSTMVSCGSCRTT